MYLSCDWKGYRSPIGYINFDISLPFPLACASLPALLVVVEFVWCVCIRLILEMRFDSVISMSGSWDYFILRFISYMARWFNVKLTSAKIKTQTTANRKKEEKNCTKKPVEGNYYIFTRTSAHWTHAASSNNKIVYRKKVSLKRWNTIWIILLSRFYLKQILEWKLFTGSIVIWNRFQRPPL